MKPIRFNKKWVLPLLLVIGMTVVVRSGVFAGTKSQTKPAETAISVKASAAALVEKAPSLGYNASIEGQTSATISAKIAGRIEQVLVQDGQIVKAGDPLVKLEAIELANAARQAGDTVRKAQANLELARNDYERYQTLFEKGAISEQQLDNAKVKLKTAEADFSSASASQSSAQQQYSYGVITAPIDGVIANKTATIGQVVAPGAALMTVQDTSSVYAVINVEQKDIGRVKIGQKASVTMDAYPDTVFNGVVKVMNPDAGSASRMFRTKILIDNSASSLRTGMFAKVEVMTGEPVRALTVPQSALLQKQGISYVFTIENGKAVRKQVEIGEVSGASIVVTSGLQPETQVITTNVNRLKEGDSVKVQ